MTFGWYDGRPCRSTCPTRRMSFCSPLWLMASAAPEASANAAETMQIENLDVVMDSPFVSSERRRPFRPFGGWGSLATEASRDLSGGFEFILRAAAGGGSAERRNSRTATRRRCATTSSLSQRSVRARLSIDHGQPHDRLHPESPAPVRHRLPHARLPGRRRGHA